ncbi:MAG TPA: DUF4446 family protein [Candidatus Limnocylindrales bacterium]|nr:DUF4446 family protein [Candidatus Limnocylindrales bacterium]
MAGAPIGFVGVGRRIASAATGGRSGGKGHLLDSGRPPGCPVRPSNRPSEDRPIDLNALVEPVLGAVVLGLGVAVLVLLLLAVIHARQVRRLRRRLDGLTRGAQGTGLDGVLEAQVDKVYAVARELDELSARSAVLEAIGRRSIQRVGLVRFNPFEDTGGNQSFALALTDAAGNGFVLSSLHSRTGTRVYAKAIAGGRSDGALSAEETEALRLAVASPATGSAAGSRPGDRASGTV